MMYDGELVVQDVARRSLLRNLSGDISGVCKNFLVIIKGVPYTASAAEELQSSTGSGMKADPHQGR